MVLAILSGVRYQEPEFLPWDGRTVPLTLLGGYLGAGKTTVINELLARTDRPIAVLVNDVGAVNVDAALIRRRNRDTIEFTDGCVCCSLSDGIGRAFDQLREREVPPDHVILELSGVADPDRVRPWGATAGFRLDGVVVLVDCDQFEELKEHPVIGSVVASQIRAADLLLLTKTDLVTPQAVNQATIELGRLAPNTPVVHSSNALAIAGLLELGANHPGGVSHLPPHSLFDQHKVEVQPLPSPITRHELEQVVATLPDTVLRAKGIALAPDGTHLLIQVVGRRRVITELSAAEGQQPTDLVVISPATTPSV